MTLPFSILGSSPSGANVLNSIFVCFINDFKCSIESLILSPRSFPCQSSLSSMLSPRFLPLKVLQIMAVGFSVSFLALSRALTSSATEWPSTTIAFHPKAAILFLKTSVLC